MACRICLQLGIDDPERWLHTTPRRVVDLWSAYWRLEPWGLPWHRHASWMTKLDAILGAIAAWLGAKHEHDKFSDHMPSDWHHPKRNRPKVSLKKQLDVLKAVYGKRK